MRVLKWILKALAGLMAVITLLVIFADDLELFYNKLTWTPPIEINGIALGMTRSDVVFKLGEPVICVTDNTACLWGDNDHAVQFRNDIVYVQSASNFDTLWSIPFKDTQDMKSLLGDEDLFGESQDFNTRRYTYLKWGVTFKYKNDALVDYMVGEVTWRSARPMGTYVVKGTAVCPGERCPFDDEDDLKEDFKSRDYTYFIN